MAHQAREGNRLAGYLWETCLERVHLVRCCIITQFNTQKKSNNPYFTVHNNITEIPKGAEWFTLAVPFHAPWRSANLKRLHIRWKKAPQKRRRAHCKVNYWRPFHLFNIAAADVEGTFKKSPCNSAKDRFILHRSFFFFLLWFFCCVPMAPHQSASTQRGLHTPGCAWDPPPVMLSKVQLREWTLPGHTVRPTDFHICLLLSRWAEGRLIITTHSSVSEVSKFTCKAAAPPPPPPTQTDWQQLDEMSAEALICRSLSLRDRRLACRHYCYGKLSGERSRRGWLELTHTGVYFLAGQITLSAECLPRIFSYSQKEKKNHLILSLS